MWLGKTSLAIRKMYLMSSPSNFINLGGFDTGLGSFACVILPLTNYKARTKPFAFMGLRIHLSIFSALLCLSYINMKFLEVKNYSRILTLLSIDRLEKILRFFCPGLKFKLILANY